MFDPTSMLPAHETPLALAILAGSAGLEYVFPPFPGDTVTLFGAFLVASRGWSLARVLAAVTLGSGIGAMVDFWLGQRAAVAMSRAKGQRWRKAGRELELLVERFRRHGPWFILVNRFFPGVRALFFVAAGMAGMPRGQVLALALVAAALWNGLLVAAGYWLGASWDELVTLAGRIGWLGWALVLLVAGLWIRHRLVH